jgi:rhodanese-related sulfurtransferase
MNVPFNELPGRLTEFIHQARPVVVVCKTDRRSLMAAQQLRKAGMPNVSVLRGRHGTVAGREPPRLQSPPRGDYP